MDNVLQNPLTKIFKSENKQGFDQSSEKALILANYITMNLFTYHFKCT